MLAISYEYSVLHLKLVFFYIGLWFDDVNSAQERQWMFCKEELGNSNIWIMASQGRLA
jgi:hypothetical protein